MFLQETHFRTDLTPKLRNHYFPTAYHSTNLLPKSKGVSILLALIDSMTDEKGIFIFLKGSDMGRRLTLANIYIPNSRQVTFFCDITKSLTTFQEGTLILGGDFNIPLNPLLDTSNGKSSLPYAAL